MAMITVFNGAFCQEEAFLKRLETSIHYHVVRDSDILSEASRLSGLDTSKIERAFSDRVSVFNRFTHEKERSLAYLRLAVSQVMERQDTLLQGLTAMLIPAEITHVLRVCLIADMPFRITGATRDQGVPEAEAVTLIHHLDENLAHWVQTIRDIKDPWDASLYDMVIPMDKSPLDQIEKLILDNLGQAVLMPTERSRQAVKDFQMASAVDVALANEGHDVSVKASNGTVAITINKHVLMLGRLEEELKAIATKVPGVKQVETKVGPGFHQSDIYRKFDFEVPSKVLLVDDEREFVQTLSERLLMREVGSAVAYDGESALELIKEDEPEVMILDLRMPGIDGVEVLRKVKETQAEIEVIILTGHGSEKDREICMALGAFAYLQKPVDIDKLSATIQAANEKIRARNRSEKDPTANG